MQQAQGAQGFDQVQLAGIEIGEILVAGQDVRHLRRALGPFARQQHPHILHRRAAAAVVEVDEMGAGVGPQNVADMAVAVQADQRLVAGAVIAMGDALQGLVHHAGPGWQQFRRNEIIVQKPGPRGGAEGGRRQGRPLAELCQGADGVDATDEPADPFAHGGVVQFRRAAAAAGKHGEFEILKAVQGAAVDAAGGHHGNFTLDQFGDKGVFLEDGGVAPAIGPVEFDDHGTALFPPDLVHAVFVAVERQQAAVAMQSDAVEGVQHAIGAER